MSGSTNIPSGVNDPSSNMAHLEKLRPLGKNYSSAYTDQHFAKLTLYQESLRPSLQHDTISTSTTTSPSQLSTRVL
jgi:hypothetical protein